MRVQDILREETDGAGGGTTPPPTTTADSEYYKAEAKKAFDARDKAKNELRALEESGRLITPEKLAHFQKLEEAAATVEEERKRKAGEFDSWRVDISKKHEEALSTEKAAVAKATERLHGVLKDHAFAAAGEWFGNSDSKTILTPAIASAYFGKHVAVEEHDGAERVVVKDSQGHVILDAKTGKPAAFSQAIGELIGMLPDKDSILRGSGKTGSGSSGGSQAIGAGGDVDIRRPLTAAELRDPAVRAKVRQQVAQAGGLQVAAGLTRR